RARSITTPAALLYPLFKFSTGLSRRKVRSDFEEIQGRDPTNCARSGHHRKKGVNLVRPSGDQALVVGLTLCSGLQNVLSQRRFDPRRCLLQRDFRHHLIQGCTHHLDQFWTVAWHELPPLLVWANLLICLPAAKTQSCEYTIIPA